MNRNGEINMKSRSFIFVGFILTFMCLSEAPAQVDAELRAKVETLYYQAEQSWAAKDLELYMSLLADDYEDVFAGSDRKGVRSVLRVRFMGYEELRAEYSILDVTRSGGFIKAAVNAKIEGKSDEGIWSVIADNTSLNLLVQEGDALKISRTTETDVDRLNNVHGQTYRDAEAGFSFTVPENWQIIPTVAHFALQRSVFVLAPDMSSSAMIGYVTAPRVNAQKAVEGDDAATKILSDPKKYELFKSGPITVDGHQGFESESKFFITLEGRERHRRRVYFDADGLLYVLCFDAIPFDQWDKMKGGFQFILDSIKVGI